MMANPKEMTPQRPAPRATPEEEEDVVLRLPSLVADLVRFSLGGYNLVIIPDSPPARENGANALPPLACRPSRVAGCVAVGDDTYTIFLLESAEPKVPETACRPRSIDFLTQRELQIATLVMQGRVNKQIAHRLHIAPNTVQSHLKRIFCKLGVSSRAAMVAQLAGCLHPTTTPR